MYRTYKKNTIIAIVVNGFMIPSFLERLFLLPLKLFTIISGSTGKIFGKE